MAENENPTTCKTGMTKLAFLIVALVVTIVGLPVILFAWRSEAAGLKELVILIIGGLLSRLGDVVNYFFGKKGE